MLISVITPCYNSGTFINETIQSVLSQTYQKFEFILIDDGSTDNTASIIKSIKDPRIRYYYQENQGQSAASNNGLKIAKGDYIKFLDSDDLINDTHLENQLKVIDGRNDIIVSCAWARFYDDTPNSAKFKPESVWEDLPSLEWIKRALSQKNDMMAAWLWLIPRNILLEVGGWDQRLSLNNDFEFTMRLLSHVKDVKFAKEANLFYRSGKFSLSQRFTHKDVEEAILSTDLGCSYFLNLENSAITRRLCADRFQEWLYRIYPIYPDLLQIIKSRILYYGGSGRSIQGGLMFQVLSKIIGWKKAKKTKQLLQNFGYKKLPFN